jgi:hypothetical protein
MEQATLFDAPVWCVRGSVVMLDEDCSGRFSAITRHSAVRRVVGTGIAFFQINVRLGFRLVSQALVRERQSLIQGYTAG